MKNLIAIGLASVAIMIGAACEVDAPVGAPTCKERFFSSADLASADYGNHTWTSDGGSGPIMGYSMQEDSRIYSHYACAKINPLY